MRPQAPAPTRRGAGRGSAGSAPVSDDEILDDDGVTEEVEDLSEVFAGADDGDDVEWDDDDEGEEDDEDDAEEVDANDSWSRGVLESWLDQHAMRGDYGDGNWD